MTAADLRSVLARLDAAKGPNRELDAYIQCVIVHDGIGMYNSVKAWVAAALQERWNVPQWTSHLHVAASLVESHGLRWSKSLDDCIYVRSPDDGTGFRPKGATVPLKLVSGVVLHLLDGMNRISTAA